MKIKKKLKLNLEQKMGLWGYVFISPFLIGFVLFFLYPFIQSFIFSLSKLTITSEGFSLTMEGIKNYYEVFFERMHFIRLFINNIVWALTDVPSIIIFSFLAANLLNDNFKGRALARMIFFLPVIFSAEVVSMMMERDYLNGIMSSGASLGEVGQKAAQGGILNSAAIVSFLYELKLPEGFINYISYAVGHVPEIIKASAIPILIFLAGLQSIPSSLYESAEIDGATGWESFWKITFPMISPLILTNIIYVIIDSFSSNELVDFIENQFSNGNYGISGAMSWSYFIFISLLLFIIYKLISSKVFYYE